MNWDMIFIIMLLLVNYPVYRFIYRLFFYDDNEFNESIRYSFTPNLISFFRGEYRKDKFSTMRLQMYVFLCVIVVVVEFTLLNKVIEFFQ